MAKKGYGEKDSGGGAGGYAGSKDNTACLGSDRDWSPPSGLPDPPGETGKIPNPK